MAVAGALVALDDLHVDCDGWLAREAAKCRMALHRKLSGGAR